MVQQSQTPLVAILTSPGMGHLIPVLEFAKRLVQFHNFDITCIIPTNGPPPTAMKEAVQALPPSLNHVFIPVEGLPDGRPQVLMSIIMKRSLSPLRDILKSLTATTRLVALVVDLFSTEAFDVANELNLPSYIFYPANAMSLSFFFYLPKLDEMVSCDHFEDLPEPIQIPGCIPVPGRDLVDAARDRKSESYKWFLYHCKRYRLAKGVAVNTFIDMEPGPLKALQEGQETGNIPPIFPVGPIIRTSSTSADDSINGDGGSNYCLKWLDDQPGGSVLFVSFGSGGTLSYNQLQELAIGLEMSGQRFLWVLRTPNDISTNAAYFNSHSENDPLSYLPQGFLDRTKGRGLVVPFWAPQAQILSHGSTGGFLSHCGWNSVLESVVHGVPIAAWPLYAEQHMNALMLTEEAKVALRLKASENGDLVKREEIARVVEGLMVGEGNEIRLRMKKMKDAAAMALKEDGSSTKALSELVTQWKTR